MAFNERALDDYVDVAERIAEFKAAFPEGSLRCIEWKIVQVEGWEKGSASPIQQTFIVYQAEADRTPDDPAPGVGTAWEVFPGRTPYTRGSELMNAETSAWGRALAALGIATKRGIASREEVRNRQAERDDGLPVNRDGSLSRSRTSDEEKAAAGVMTSAQQAEHSRLAKPPPNTGEVIRLRSSDGTVGWLGFGEGGGELPPIVEGQPTEDTPGTIDSRQSRAMHAEFKRLGIADRAERLKITSDTLGRPLGSSGELSWREADALLAALKEMKPDDAAG